MTAGTPQEQLMLELTNRARMNPAAEAARLNVTLDPGQGGPKPILAMNNRLQAASDRHSNWMLINDQFNHQESTAFPNGRTGLEPGDRMRAAGYTFSGNWTWGENIAWSGTTGTLNATAAIYGHHEALFRSDGHRANTLNAVFREAGIGQQIGDYRGYNASMLTENFARSGTKLFVSGALFNDTDRDFFYDVGEQVAGRSVTATGGVSDVTGAGGGYALGFSTTGLKTISFAMPSGTISLNVNVASANLKIDIVSGTKIWTNASVSTNSTNVTEMRALGIQALNLTAGAGNQNVVGNAAANTLNGGAGNDGLFGAGGNDTLRGGVGNDTLSGSSGNDALAGGANADAFVFNTSPSVTNRDTITDFSVADDIIRLDNAVFKALGATGALAAVAFFKSAAGIAHDANDRIVYDTDNGWLTYDSNGNAAGGAVIFARVAAGLAITAADFVVI